MKKRREIEEKFKWDLSKFCKSDEEFLEKLENLEKKIVDFAKFEGRLSDDDVLFEYLEFQNNLSKEADFLSYAFYRQCEDGSDRNANDMMEKRNIICTKISVASTPLDVEIDKFSEVRLKALQNNSKFINYKRYFEGVLRHKKHSLTKSEELLLSKLGEFTGGFSDNYDKFSDVDLKFDKIADSKGKSHDFNQSLYSTYVESKDRVLRENAFKEINGKRGKFINFLAQNYINDVKENCVFAKIRKYKSALSQAIFCEEASEDVYNMLVKKVRENVDIMERYFEIKRKMLGLKNFAIYDTFAPVSSESGKKFTYEQAIEIIKQAVAPLGEEYVALVQRAKDERWIDVLPNENKYSGAYSSGSNGKNVILTNFTGNYESVFTLAHELGHAIHSYFSFHNQPYQTSDYVIFVAEVASTTNEMLLLNFFLQNAKTEKEKIMWFNHFLKDVKSTIFRQTMFAEFEQFAHEEYEKERPLSAQLLCEKYSQLNKFYHGKKVKQIEEMKFEWSRIPHFYDSFYVYKYATGLICAIKISSQILRDENFAKKYISFLSSGSSDNPISLLRIADCDLEKEETFDEAFAVCNEFLLKWEALLKKKK